MGFLSRYSSGGALQPVPGNKAATIQQARQEGANLWQRVFGTDKESGGTNRKVQPLPNPAPGWVASAGNTLAQQRLLMALRTKSPGGWSDNRYEQAAHYTGIAFVAIFRLMRMMGQGEFQVFIDDPSHPEGRRPVTRDDPPQGGSFFHGTKIVERSPLVKPYDLVELLKKPNPLDSFGKMLMRFTLQKYLTGTRLCWMVPNDFGSIAELYPIETVIAQPQPIINPEYPDGFYRIQPLYPNGPFSSYPTVNAAAGAIIPAEWMLKDAFPHPFLRYEGYSPLTGMRLHVDEVESMDRSRWYRMKRDIRPNAILQMTEAEGTQPLPPEEIERIRAEFEAEFQSPENFGKLMVTYPGCELQLQTDTQEVDYYQGWEQLVSFVMGGFGITKEAAGMISDASYAALFATLKQLQFITLDPESQDIGQDFTRNLAPFFGDGLTVEVRCRRIDDHEIIFQKIEMGIKCRNVTKNQALKMMDMPTTAEPWGNDIVGDPSPNETLMQTQMMMAALPDETEEQETGMIKPGGLPNEDKPDPEPPEISGSRPRTGSLGKGSKGPKAKSLMELFDKVDRLNKYRNGLQLNGKHK